MNGSITSQALLLAIYSGLIILASLAGGWIPLAVRLTHTRLQVAISFVAGLMLGIGLLHLLPHAWHQTHSVDRTVKLVLAGFLVMFFAQRFFQFHHHDVPDASAEEEESGHAHDHESHGHSLAEKSARRLSWAGAAVGLTLHSIIDGVALAASVRAEAGSSNIWVTGIGTFLVIILHKPFDAMAISTLMAAGGRSRYSCHLVNFLFALAIPLGVGTFLFAANLYSDRAGQLLGAALAFTAGTFLCISTSDLLPEIQFHTHDRFKLSIALVSGLLLSILIGRFEHSGHDHHDNDERQAAPIKLPG